MTIRLAQQSFNSGELSELMSGRSDDPKYPAGLATAKNVIVTPQGPVKNRSGFMYVNKTKFADKPCRIIPFTYSASQTMVIELGDKYARFHTQGKTLMKGGVPYEIATPWSAEHVFDIHYTQNADVMTLVHPLYPPQELRRYSESDWRCVPVVINAQLGVPQGVTAVKETEAAQDENKDKYVQKYVVTALTEDRTQESLPSGVASVGANLFATGTTVKISWEAVENAKFYRVYKLQGGLYGYIGETAELSIIDDNIAPETGQTPPYLDTTFQTAKGITSVEVTAGGSGYSSINNAIADFRLPIRDIEGDPVSYTNSSEYVATTPKFNAKLIDRAGVGKGASIELDVEYRSWRENVQDNTDEGYHYEYYKQGTVKAIRVTNRGEGYLKPVVIIKGEGKTVVPKPGGGYEVKDREWEVPVSTLDTSVYVNVTDETGSGAILKANVSGGVITSISVVYGGSNYTDPKITITSTQGSGAQATATTDIAGDYPSAVGYFEQRRVFAGTLNRPQQIWMTKTGTESNMSYHIPVKDDDRISFAVSSRDLNQILHVVALQQLVMLTSAAEWRVSPLNSDAITPSSISVRPQSYVGASNVQPVLVNNTLLYPASRGGHIREFAYNYQAGGYISGDVSLRAEHLFDGKTIVDMAYSKAPYPIVWCVSSDGKLLGLTYVPEQQIGAWHQHTTRGFFESCASVQEGKEDYLYVVTYRELASGGARFIERLSSREDVNEIDGMFADCCARYEGELTNTVSGVEWLEGEKVSVLADGAVIKDVPVENGAVTLPVKAYNVTLGLPYVSTIKTLPVAAPISDGSMAKGHTKNINKVWVRLYKSSGVAIGPTEDSAKQIAPRKDEIYGTPPKYKSGEYSSAVPGSWGKDGSFCVVQKDPLPMTILSVASEVEIGG